MALLCFLEIRWKSDGPGHLLETMWPQSTGSAGGNGILCFPGPCGTVAVEGMILLWGKKNQLTCCDHNFFCMFSTIAFGKCLLV